MPLTPTFDFSYRGVVQSFEESLERLGLDRVDIVFIHDPDEDDGLGGKVDHLEEVIQGALPAILNLKAQGRIGAIGVAMDQSAMLVQFARLGVFDCLLLGGAYTLLDADPADDLLPLCQAMGISLIIGGPFSSGILASGAVTGATYRYQPATSEIVSRVQRIADVCARYRVPMAAAALQFPFGHSSVVSVIPGARSAEEVRDNARMFAAPIEPDFWWELKDTGILPRSAPLPV